EVPVAPAGELPARGSKSTPGAACNSVLNPRPFGVASINFSVRFVEDLLEETSIASEDALIVTDSVTAPALSVISNVNSLPNTRLMSSFLLVLNPVWLTVIVYKPTGNFGNR